MPGQVRKAGAKKVRRKEKKNVAHGHAHIKSTFNNTIAAGVICEVMNDDGTMARVPDLERYCERHGMKMITVADLIAYRRRHESSSSAS